MTTDRASQSPTGGPCLRPFIAQNRLVIAQLAARVSALPLRLGLSSGSTVARSRSPTRRAAAPDYESFAQRNQCHRHEERLVGLTSARVQLASWQGEFHSPRPVNNWARSQASAKFNCGSAGHA